VFAGFMLQKKKQQRETNVETRNYNSDFASLKIKQRNNA